MSRTSPRSAAPSRVPARASLRAPLAVLAVAPLLGACISFSWTRERVHEPPLQTEAGAVAATARFTAGETTLTEALAALGAPNLVRDLPGGRVACVWTWTDARIVGVSFSLPLGESVDASLAYDDERADARGLTLFFDAAWVLEDWREGHVAGALRARVAAIDGQ